MHKLLLAMLLVAAACSPASKETADTNARQSETHMAAPAPFNVYAEVDSVFNINGKLFHLNVKQLDLTEMAAAEGDTLSRPTYACLVQLENDKKEVLFQDSLLRDSWGYPGKISSINAYQLAMPMIELHDQNVVLSFVIADPDNEEAIKGFIEFDTHNKKSRYYWEEFYGEE